jgi:hypothetical protein
VGIGPDEGNGSFATSKIGQTDLPRGNHVDRRTVVRRGVVELLALAALLERLDTVRATEGSLFTRACAEKRDGVQRLLTAAPQNEHDRPTVRQSIPYV